MGDSTPHATLTIGNSKSGSKNRLFSANNPTVGEGLMEGGGSKNPFSFHSNSVALDDITQQVSHHQTPPVPIAGGHSTQQKNKLSSHKESLGELGKHD